jgi:hypothetical protein
MCKLALLLLSFQLAQSPKGLSPFSFWCPPGTLCALPLELLNLKQVHTSMHSLHSTKPSNDFELSTLCLSVGWCTPCTCLLLNPELFLGSLMHSLHLINAHLQSFSYRVFNNSVFFNFSNTSERVGSVHSLHLLKALLVEPFLQSVQKLCGVFSLAPFSLNLKQNSFVHTCTCSMPTWQSSIEYSTTLSFVPSLHSFSSKVFSNLEAPL